MYKFHFLGLCSFECLRMKYIKNKEFEITSFGIFTFPSSRLQQDVIFFPFLRNYITALLSRSSANSTMSQMLVSILTPAKHIPPIKPS